MKLFTLFSILASLFFVSCAGYQMGGSKPSNLKHVKRIYVPLFKNDTQLTKADSYATNSAIDAILQDGAYGIGTADSADAILQGSVSKIKYSQASSSRDDTLRTEELSMTVTITWTLRDAENPVKILARGKSRGVTRFFTGANLEIARMNALPDALQRANQDIVSKIANGF